MGEFNWSGGVSSWIELCFQVRGACAADAKWETWLVAAVKASREHRQTSAHRNNPTMTSSGNCL